jgi:maleamate amidohydrolase
MNESAVYARQVRQRLRLAPPFGLLLVDFVHGFADPGAFGGGNIGPAIARSVDLLAHARKAAGRWPIRASSLPTMAPMRTSFPKRCPACSP